MRRRLALPLGLLLGWMPPVRADLLLLRSAAQSGFPHKYNVGGAGQPGFCIEYIQALSQTDPELVFSGLDEMLPTLRIEQELAAGRVEVFFGMLKTPEREALYRFADNPRIYTIHHQVAVRAADLQADQVHGIDDLRAAAGHRVILATRGSGYANLLRDQGLHVDDGATSVDQNLRKLISGRSRFLYDSESSLRRAIEANGLQAQVRILPAVLRRQDLLLAYTPALSAERLARILAAMRALEASGGAARLRLAYGLR
ncbi:MAG: transporter substrate-binding domain-containing protein [Burkholderiales bacterium]|nr:transporter substrate-binding domain-containing protein [Burkholderiales bacterium]